MTRGDRAVVDVERARLTGVTARAAGIGRVLGLVHLVTVETPAQTGMLGLLLGVTLGARLRLERR